MKTKLFDIAGAAVLAVPLAGLLALGLGLAGCGTTSGGSTSTGGGGTGSGGAPTAAGLATNLNAITAGSATIDGATVRITGAVYLKTSLTVPAGVTLDLTADGVKFELQNGATLTVDGTVNSSGHGDHGKGHVDGGLRIGDGTAVINGSGTIRLQSKGRLLNIGGDKKHLTLDGVTLVGIADNDNSLVQVDNGGELVLKSGAITGNVFSMGEWVSGAGVSVNGKGTTFIMEGGAISGNSATSDRTYGGGVRVEDSGTFTMKGGKISGNSANGSVGASGGGVLVQAGSVFTMEGGEISGNSVTGKEWCNAGGVQAWGTFTMSGGIISDNNVTGNEAKGGGVKVEGGTFTMQGGAISGNSIGGSGGNWGAGVMVDSSRDGVSTFIMLGGTIYGSASVANAGDNANEVRDGSGAPVTGRGAAISVAKVAGEIVVAKWGTGGAYTKGGVAQTGGSDIVGRTDDTLIATPAR